MTIEVKDDGYYLGVWFVEGYDGNFLGSVYRLPRDAPRLLVYRFRYYDKAHDSADEKSWYTATVDDSKTDDEMIAVMDGMLDHLKAAGYCAPSTMLHKIHVKGDGKAMMQGYQQLPFYDARWATPEEMAEVRKRRG